MAEAPEKLLVMASEIDESESKITFVNQCMKAQDDLCKRLKQEAKRLEDDWRFMKLDNQKLETEIKNAENETKSSSIAIEALRCSNVEMRKELLVTKETYKTMVESVKDGEKKYDAMWVEAKQRFESIAFVQEWMKVTQHAEALQSKLDALDHDAQKLEKEKQQKKRQLLAEERKRIIDLAEYLNGYNATIKTIKDKKQEVAKVAKEVETLKAKQRAEEALGTRFSKLIIKPNEEVEDDNWLNLRMNIYDDSLMKPKLRSSTIRKDVLNLNKVPTQVTAIKKATSMSESGSFTKRVTPEISLNEQFISCYLRKPIPEPNGENTGTEYSNRKLINILDDIKLNDSETYDIISKTNPDNLQEVSVIAANFLDKKNDKESSKNDKGLIVGQEIDEEIYSTFKNSQTVLLPPTQFADLNKVQHEDVGTITADTPTRTVMVNMSMEQDVTDGGKNASNAKKTVSFDIPMSVSVLNVTEEMDTANAYKPNDTIESATSQADDNAHDTCIMNIRQMLFKKQDLDLSPQFVYRKNNSNKMKTDETAAAVVTSKFFETNVEANEKQTDVEPSNTVAELKEVPDKTADNEKQCIAQTQEVANENPVAMDSDNMKSPPKKQPVGEIRGMLFNHGAQGITDSLDISMNTSTGYDVGDADFPQYLDSSMMFSPKAVNVMPPMEFSGTTPGVESQEVPNFLSDFKKTGLSFFKPSPGTSSDANTQNQESNFNFDFGGTSEEKKRKGLFSFFR